MKFMRKKDKLKKYLSENKYKYHENYSIKNLTTIGVGGNADYVVYPLNLKEFIKLIKFVRNNEIKYEILGNGSNVLYSDNRFKGVIISTIYISKIYCLSNKLYVSCGTKLPYLSFYSMKRGISNFESLALIPGTIGASIVINAGAYGRTIGDSVDKVVIMDTKSKIRVLNKEQLKFSYRNSNLKEERMIVLYAILEGVNKDKNEIKSLMDLYAKKRYETQPLYDRNFGSIFKNPPQKKVYEIIQECNLTDYKYRGVRLSKKHSNFLQISTNNSSKDILYFIENLRKKVYNIIGILLDNEVILVNWRRKYVKRITRTYKKIR